MNLRILHWIWTSPQKFYVSKSNNTLLIETFLFLFFCITTSRYAQCIVSNLQACWVCLDIAKILRGQAKSGIMGILFSRYTFQVCSNYLIFISFSFYKLLNSRAWRYLEILFILLILVPLGSNYIVSCSGIILMFLVLEKVFRSNWLLKK